MCRVHATVRGLLGEIVGGASDVAVADMEAGLEHLSRGTPRHVDTILAVLEPYYRSLETGARVLDLSRELGIARAYAVGNKLRNDEDRQAVEAFCRSRGLTLLASVPHDEAILEADRRAAALIDCTPDAPSVRAIASMTDRLLD
jgi:CO dehydrogenase maturation factor